MTKEEKEEYWNKYNRSREHTRIIMYNTQRKVKRLKKAGYNIDEISNILDEMPAMIYAYVKVKKGEYLYDQGVEIIDKFIEDYYRKKH